MRRLLPLILLLILASCTQEENPNRALAKEVWNTFEENYAFFALRGIDWASEQDTLLDLAEQATTSQELFDALCSRLQRFDDSHINLVAPDLQIQCNGGATPSFFNEFPDDDSYQAFLRLRDSTLNEIGIAPIGPSMSGLFEYGISEDASWGFLRINRFYGIGERDLETELDRIFEGLQPAKALLLDIRTNPGGNDATARKIAERFYLDRKLGYFKQTRNGAGHEDLTEPEPFWLEPKAGQAHYSGPVYLLQNGAAGSAADVFALMIYQRENVTSIGTETEGIFSDMYRDTLSNGWTLTLSHQRYLAENLACYEKVGVPVEFELENTKEDLERGFDPVIKAATQIHAGELE